VHHLVVPEDPSAGVENVLVYRVGLHAQSRVISTVEAALLSALMAGRPLAEALQDSVVAGGETAVDVLSQHLARWTQRWTGDEMVVSVRLVGQ
jgi:hypothetical protein